jgi:L-ascorbate metabolism protein UlaG (beta-lactamase superfamily)
VATADRSDVRPAGGKYSFGWGTGSRKVAGPAIAASDLPPIDAVLLSHDHHGDNLDAAGRALVPSLRAAMGRPGHGVLWISGDTVLYDGVRQVADRLKVGTALLHLGAVRFPVTGPVRYSMTSRWTATPTTTSATR